MKNLLLRAGYAVVVAVPSGWRGLPAWLSTEGAGLSVTELLNGGAVGVDGNSNAGAELNDHDGVRGKCGVSGLLGNAPEFRDEESLMSICRTLCNTSPEPGLLSPRSAFVRRHSALPERKIWTSVT